MLKDKLKHLLLLALQVLSYLQTFSASAHNLSPNRRRALQYLQTSFSNLLKFRLRMYSPGFGGTCLLVYQQVVRSIQIFWYSSPGQPVLILNDLYWERFIKQDSLYNISIQKITNRVANHMRNSNNTAESVKTIQDVFNIPSK